MDDNNEKIDSQLEDEEASEEKITREEEIFKRLHEIDLILEEYDDKLCNYEIRTLEPEQVKEYKQEYNTLRKELKSLKTTVKKEGWETIPIWLVIYGIIVVVLGMYPFVPMLPLDIITLIYPLFPTSLKTNFVFYALFIIYSLLLILPTLLIWLYSKKDKSVKKNIFILLIIQLGVAIISNLIAFF